LLIQERFAGDFFAGDFFAGVFFAVTAGVSFGGERNAITEAPSSRVSAVDSILGDLAAFAASFLIFGDVSCAGALGMD
jgi:drug/metabolite transporter (DMT)-like permease